MLKILLVLLSSVVLVACSTTGSSGQKVLNSALLKEMGVLNAQPSTKYAFDEFYKTSGISGFEFSPDKTKLYFLKSDGKVKNVFSLNLATNKMIQVTSYKEPVSWYLVGPKGKKLYIQKDVGGSEIYDLYEFHLASKRTVAITKGKKIERSYLCDVSENGERLYFSQSRQKRSYYDIKAFDIKNRKISTLVKANKAQLYCGSLDKEAKYLSFSRFIDNNERHLGYVNLKDSKVNYVVAEKGVANASASFDSNGGIVFVSTKDSDINRIWRYEISNGKLELIDSPIDRDVTSIGIFARGKVSVINYRGQLEPKTKIFNGRFGKKLNLPVASSKIKAAYFDKTIHDLGVLEVQEGASPLKYYLVRSGKKSLIFDSNQSKIPSTQFSKSHSRFIKSFDGTKVPTHFFIPNGTSAKNKKPVIFWIHGGPENHVDPLYSPRIQYLVNNGYIVVAPNVRGSSGYGKKYRFMDNGDWGGGHIKDIVAVANFTKGLDFVESDKMMILGGSFGGFSVMSLITQYPKLFAAAVNIFGPIEFASFLGSWPPIAQAYWIKELGVDPRKDKAFNRRVSPLYHIDKIQIPLQVHQGANDIRVPKTQSDKLVKGLKKRSISVKYFVYSDEGHGFTKFKNTKKCFTRVVGFAKTHLNNAESSY